MAACEEEAAVALRRNFSFGYVKPQQRFDKGGDKGGLSFKGFDSECQLIITRYLFVKNIT